MAKKIVLGKDWTGGSSMLKTNTRIISMKDADEDFYATHPDSIVYFLKQLEKDGVELPKNAWENAVGQGHISMVLEKAGFTVFRSDIKNRGANDETIDFLNQNLHKNEYDLIITNPPYKYALEFCIKSLEYVKENGWVCMFLPFTFLEGKKRFSFFKKFPPKYIYLYVDRQGCGLGGGDFANTGARAYCFLMWRQGEISEPILKWIEP
jgi:hypothetical protein